MNGEGIPAPFVFTMVRRLMEFPFPQICRHLVAAELLGALKEAGCTIPEGAISAAFRAHDDEVLAMIPEPQKTA